MAVEVTYNSILSVKETLGTGVSLVTTPNVTHDGLSTGGTFNASSTVPATKVSSGAATLAAGVATINLAAMPGVNGATVDFTGLKVQFVKLQNPSANAITIVPGAANGIDLFGAASSVSIQPGQEMLFKFNDTGPDVAAADRTLDLTGTLVQTLNFVFVAG